MMLHAYVMLHNFLLQYLLDGWARLWLRVKQATYERLDFWVVGIGQLRNDIIHDVWFGDYLDAEIEFEVPDWLLCAYLE